MRGPSSLYCFLGSGTTCALWIEDQHAVLSVKIDDMQDIATRSKVRFLFTSGVHPHDLVGTVVPRVCKTRAKAMDVRHVQKTNEPTRDDD